MRLVVAVTAFGEGDRSPAGTASEHRHEAVPELRVARFGASQLEQSRREVDELDQLVARLAYHSVGRGDDEGVAHEAVVDTRSPLLDESEVAQVLAMVGEVDDSGAVGGASSVDRRQHAA